MDESMPRAKSKQRVARRFVTQLFAAVPVNGLRFAGVGFSRTVIARPLGGDESGSNGIHAIVPKNFKLPKGLIPQPGQTYIRGKNDTAPLVIHLNRGDAAIDCHAWTSALQIDLLVGMIAIALAWIDRGLRIARRHRISS